MQQIVQQAKAVIKFCCDDEEADTKMFLYVKFLCDKIRVSRATIVSPDMLRWYLYDSVPNLTFLDAIWFKIGAEDDQRYIHLYIYYP